MNNAIKRAIEGGWKPKSTPTGLYHFQSFDGYLIDPLFWQALGKAEGWKSRFEISTGLVWEDTLECPMSDGKLVDKWEYEMHRFIDHLIAEKPIDDFFNNLLTNTQ